MSDWEDQFKTHNNSVNSKVQPEQKKAVNEDDWENKYATSSSSNDNTTASSTSFIPSIGGVVKKEDEKYTNPKYWLAQGLGGTVTRGIPGIRNLIPITETQQKGMEEHPNIETLGNVTGAMLPAAVTGGIGASPTTASMLSALKYGLTQGGINAGINTADRIIENPNASGGDLAKSAATDAALSTAIPVGMKALSPYAAPALETLGGYVDRTSKIAGAREAIENAANKYTPSSIKDNWPTLALLGEMGSTMNSHVGHAIAGGATLAKFGPEIAKSVVGNQLGTVGKMGAAEGIANTGNRLFEQLSESERQKLKALAGGQ